MTSTAERKCEELALLGNHVAIYGAEQQTKEECRQRQPDQETQVRGYFSEKKNVLLSPRGRRRRE